MAAAKPRYGVLLFDRSHERSEETFEFVALLILVIGLAVATIWFVALPLLDEPDRRPGKCQTLVLTRSGTTKCVPGLPSGAPIPRADG